jgi:hypothetical protein
MTDLNDIRKSIASIDAARNERNLTQYERDALELSAIALRDAERVEITKIQKSITTELSNAVAPLKEHSAKMRDIVTRINKGSKIIDLVEESIRVVANIITAISKY